ncbi:MAG TPA: DUF6644 family protein [Albitalea sp.]
MLEDLASALQAGALSHTLRSSIWLYPLVNTVHVVGIALLFGGIVPLDLRLLGWRKSVPLDHVARCSVPVAVAGLLLAAASGSLLFVTRPLDYVGEPLFGIKMALLFAALLNVLALRRSMPWRRADAAPGHATHPSWRFAALMSIVLWLGVITAGRLIGYR